MFQGRSCTLHPFNNFVIHTSLKFLINFMTIMVLSFSRIFFHCSLHKSQLRILNRIKLVSLYGLTIKWSISEIKFVWSTSIILHLGSTRNYEIQIHKDTQNNKIWKIIWSKKICSPRIAEESCFESIRCNIKRICLSLVWASEKLKEGKGVMALSMTAEMSYQKWNFRFWMQFFAKVIIIIYVFAIMKNNL